MGEELTRIGVTGHMNLSPETVELVRVAIREQLRPHAGHRLEGVSCIAAGSDSIFAEVVLELGGSLEVVLPSADYRERKVKPAHAVQFDSLIRRAARVRTTAHAEANPVAYEAANEVVLSSCDLLLAVWDGCSPADQGGTAAVVEQARERGLPVIVLWPDGALRVPK
ncbi:hypothetical protein [Hamadaea tsunoensis]|uniref:hypothetical protein n=1 Tax=Hamadaea tsunoensis TaxID=53368 RepID=UPI000A0237B5|nr:hypothetical protein [Hamadaea tsunoensis]